MFIENIGPEPTFITGLPDVLIETEKLNKSAKAELNRSFGQERKLDKLDFIIKNKDKAKLCGDTKDTFVNARCSVLVGANSLWSTQHKI